MKMERKIQYPLTFVALLSNIIISSLPGYWWYYSIGQLGIIQDSPFQLDVKLLNNDLLIINIINVFLFAFRFYVISISLYYAYLILAKKKKETYLTITWLSYLYILDPIIVYLIFNFILNHFIPIQYNLFIIGKENTVISSHGYVINTYIESYPTFEYLIALIGGTLNLASRVVKKL